MLEAHDITVELPVATDGTGDGARGFSEGVRGGSDEAADVSRGVNVALSGVTLRVRTGELVCVVGPNGAGKSLLAGVLAGSAAPTGGEVLLDGVPVSGEALHTRVGRVRQDPESQIVAPVVFDEVAFGPCNLGLPAHEVRARVKRALGSCGLEGFEGRAVSDLSGGELQRVAIAGILAMRPDYLVLDEVTSQLDAVSTRRVMDVVRAVIDDGVGVVLVSHDVAEVALADRVLLLQGGAVAWEGAPGELFSDEGRMRAAGLEGPMAHVLVLCGGELSRRGRGGAREGLSAWAIVDALERAGRVEDAMRLLRQNSRTPVCEEGGRAGVEDGRAGLGSSHARVEDGCASLGSGRAGLVLSDVSVSAGEAHILRGVTLFARPGRVTLLAGLSGSGKSTVMRVAAGLLEPDAGVATIDGAPVRPGLVGFAQQRAEDQLFCDTVLDDVAYGPGNLGLSRAEARERAEGALVAIGLAQELWGRSPFALSGGQRRRAALAGVLAMEAVAVVLDEPTNGLDGDGRRLIHEAVRRLAREGRSVLVTSHDVSEWLMVADDVALLRDGRVSWSGAAEELVADAAPFEAAGLGTPLWLQVLGQLERPESRRAERGRRG